MSDRMTSCTPRDKSIRPPISGVADHGRQGRAKMIAFFRSYYEHQKAEADAALALTDDELIVETYVGSIVRRGATEVTDTAAGGSGRCR